MPKPSLGQGVLVILGILALYMLVMCIEPIVDAFLMWLDKLPAGERRFVLLALPLALVAGLVARRLNEGGMR